MMQKLTLRAMLLSSACLLPLKAMGADLGAASAAPEATAQMTSDNEITFGLLGLTGTNTGLYGRYNGFTEEGVDGLFGFSAVTRSAWDSGGTRYQELTGSNLNYQFGNHLTKTFTDSTYSNKTANDLGPNAALNFRIGDQGHWGITGSYNAISYTGNIIDSIYTISGAVGTLNNGLPPWGGATNSPSAIGSKPNSFNAATLTPYERMFQVGTRRDIVGLTGKYIWNDWIITGAVRHEHKEGTLEESLRETYGGQAFTLPIDYDTDRYDVTAAYNVPGFQASLGYMNSRFTDYNTAVSLPYPASATSPPYAQTGLYSTPPSNDAHYVTAMLGYNLTPETRLNLNARYGLELQNSTFPANTGDPNITNSSTGFAKLTSLLQGTSATSPDARAQIYHGSLAVTSTPIANLNASASYSIDGRDVSINQFGVFDGASSPDAASYGGTTNERYVVPQGWLKQKVKAEVAYRVLPQSNTKVTLGYEFDDTDRSNAQVGHSNTNVASAGLSSMLGSALMGRISYEHGERSGVLKYWVPWANLENNTGLGAPSGAYYQAPMTSDAIIIRSDYSPGGAFSGGVSLKARNENFHYPSDPFGENLVNQVEGIKQDYNLTAGVDGNYRPAENVNFHAYYTYEEIFFNNLGNGACANSNTTITSGTPAITYSCAGSAGYFQNKETTGVHTVGLNTEWQATDKLKLSAEYTFAYGSVMFGEYNGVFVPPGSENATFQNVANYPDNNSIMNTLTLKTKYQLNANTELSLGGMYSMFRSTNWNDQTGPVVNCTGVGCTSTTTIAILTPGYGSPNYNVGVLMAALKVKW